MVFQWSNCMVNGVSMVELFGQWCFNGGVFYDEWCFNGGICTVNGVSKVESEWSVVFQWWNCMGE